MTNLQSESSSAAWDDRQRGYWSALAKAYDGLYESQWSSIENDWVASRLGFLEGSKSPRILDLGCGTGLGAELASRWTDLDGYTGVDISPEMTRITASRYTVDTRVSSMEDLDWVDDHSVDVVMALFSSASFAASFSELLRQVARVLRPGGQAYLSTLGRASKSAIQKTNFRTRGQRIAHDSVPAHRFRTTHLLEAADRVGMTNAAVSGMNTLAGLVEVPRFWGVGAAMAKKWPNTSHLLELTCTSPRPAQY